jgi:hypothetical protein
MAKRKSDKKVTRVEGGGESAGEQQTSSGTFRPTEENKGKAKQLRLFAILAWILALGAQGGAIYLLFQPPVDMTWLIVLIVVDLILAIVGAQLWKKSNRLDPPSEKNRFLFFMQSQLGLVAAIIAFLPLIIFIFTSKNLDKKQKGILGGIAVVALLIAGIAGVDFNPPSVEQYTEQTKYVEKINNNQNLVYWTKAGTVYHLESGCSYINTDKTDEIFEGTVAQARELKNITNLCSLCERRALKNNSLDKSEIEQEIESELEAEESGEESDTEGTDNEE